MIDEPSLITNERSQQVLIKNTLSGLCQHSPNFPCSVPSSSQPDMMKSWAQSATSWQIHAQVAMVTGMGKKSHSEHVENDVYIVKRRPLLRTHSITVTFDLLLLYCYVQDSPSTLCLWIPPGTPTFSMHICEVLGADSSASHGVQTPIHAISHRHLLQIIAPWETID